MDGNARRRRSATHAEAYREMIRRLRQARLDAGLKQAEVAAMIGRPQSFVAKSELGERRIDPIDLQQFAEVYGKTLQHFVRRR